MSRNHGGGGLNNTVKPQVNPFYIEQTYQQGRPQQQYLETEEYYDDDDELDDEDLGLLNDHYSNVPMPTSMQPPPHRTSFGNARRNTGGPRRSSSLRAKFPTTPRTERRCILGVVAALLFGFLWMATKGDTNTRGNNNNTQQSQHHQQVPGNYSSSSHHPVVAPLPDRVILLGERHSGVEFYHAKLQACFPHLNFDTILSRESTWFQDPPLSKPKKNETLQFIVVVRNPFTWMEAMRLQPWHMPLHTTTTTTTTTTREPLDWQAFLEQPWTWSNQDNHNKEDVPAAGSSPPPTASPVGSGQSPDPSSTSPPTPTPQSSFSSSPPTTTTSASLPVTTPPTTATTPSTTTPTDEKALNDALMNMVFEDDDDNNLMTPSTGNGGGRERRRHHHHHHHGRRRRRRRLKDHGRRDETDGSPFLATGDCQQGFTPSQVQPCHWPPPPQSAGDNPEDEIYSPIYELNPSTGQAFGSILELRAAKIRHYYRTLGEWWKDYLVAPVVLLHYEHTVWASLERVFSITGWTHNTSSPECHNLNVRPPALEHTLQEVDPAYLQYLIDHVQWSVEAQVGYQQDDHS